MLRVNSKRGKANAFIGVGSNLDKPLDQCQSAIASMSKLPGVQIIRRSSFYSSEPLMPKGRDPSGTPWYINAVCLIRTRLTAQDLLRHLLKIEIDMGRRRRKKWESRIIDLDLLSYEDMILHTGRLTLPHPRLPDRRFVLEPLYEIAPQWEHPLLGKTVYELRNQTRDELKVEKIESSSCSARS